MKPYVFGIVCAVIGGAAFVTGVYVLVGLGWALLAAGLPFVGLSVLAFRGIMRGD